MTPTIIYVAYKYRHRNGSKWRNPILTISNISHPKTTGNIYGESTKDPCRMSFRFLSMAERHDLIPKRDSNQEKSQSQFYFHGLQIIKWGYKKGRTTSFQGLESKETATEACLLSLSLHISIPTCMHACRSPPAQHTCDYLIFRSVCSWYTAETVRGWEWEPPLSFSLLIYCQMPTTFHRCVCICDIHLIQL